MEWDISIDSADPEFHSVGSDMMIELSNRTQMEHIAPLGIANVCDDSGICACSIDGEIGIMDGQIAHSIPSESTDANLCKIKKSGYTYSRSIFYARLESV